MKKKYLYPGMYKLNKIIKIGNNHNNPIIFQYTLTHVASSAAQNRMNLTSLFYSLTTLTLLFL